MGFIGAERDPRIVLFGDITGIPVQTIHGFFKAAGRPLYGGSFPSCHNRQRAEVVRETHELLIQTEIPDPSPITPCDSEEDKVRQMLQNPSLLSRIGDTGRSILIIDSNPESLVQNVAHRQTDFHPGILSHTTVISLGPGKPVDYVDPNTNMRIVTLSPYCYPTHPTPAS